MLQKAATEVSTAKFTEVHILSPLANHKELSNTSLSNREAGQGIATSA